MDTDNMLIALSKIHDGPCMTIYGVIPRETLLKGQVITALESKSIRSTLNGITQESRITGMLDDMKRTRKELGNTSGDWGYAIFASEAVLEYLVGPFKFLPSQLLGDCFDLRQLASQIHHREHFCILSLHNEHCSLYRCDPYSTQRIDLPHRIAVHGLEESRESSAHTAGHLDTHGASLIRHGVQERDRKHELLRYFSLVDRSVQEYLRGIAAQVFLSGVSEEVALYRKHSGITRLNPLGLRPARSMEDIVYLRKLAEIALEQQHRERLIEASAEFTYQQSRGTATTDLGEIQSLAGAGRIKALFVEPDSALPGIAAIVRDAIRTGTTLYVMTPDLMPAPNYAAIKRY